MSEHHGGVWVYSENVDLMQEILSKANELAGKMQTEVAALLIGHEVKSRGNELIDYGASKVYIVDIPTLKDFQSEKYLSALTTLMREHKPEILLVGSTRKGRELRYFSDWKSFSVGLSTM